LNARYYDPVLSRFLSPDPLRDLGNVATFDPYAYAGGNPVLNIDPSGLNWFSDHWVAITTAVVVTVVVVATAGTAAPVAFASASASFATGSVVVLDATVATIAVGTAGIATTTYLATDAFVSTEGGFGDRLSAAEGGATNGIFVTGAAALITEGIPAQAQYLQSRVTTWFSPRGSMPPGSGLSDPRVGPGPYAVESVEATGPRITSQQQQDINRLGNLNGCHSCGTRNPGTRSGNFVGDHQDPTAFGTEPQVLYPQCLRDSNIQGGVISQILRGSVVAPPTASFQPVSLGPAPVFPTASQNLQKTKTWVNSASKNKHMYG